MSHLLRLFFADRCFRYICFAALAFALLFAWISLRRIDLLWASYFDLGIMHQTVYNTYQALVTGDVSRILEMTDPLGSGLQVKRMAIHNDVLLTLIAPLYFIYAGPQTLLVLQSFAAASGAIALYLITKKLFEQHHAGRWSRLVSTVLALAYLLYAPLQRSILYEFHAVVLATALILWMYLAYLHKRYVTMAVLGFLVLLAKEQTGFSLGVFLLVEAWRSPLQSVLKEKSLVPIWSSLRHLRVRLLTILGVFAFVYVIWTVFLLIPAYRSGADHFALSYFGSSEAGGGIGSLIRRLLSADAGRYVRELFAPLLFLPLGSILVLPALPDLFINLLSSSGAMRNIYFHYTAVITPWLFIAIASVLARMRVRYVRKVSVILLIASVLGTVTLGPVPEYASRAKEIVSSNLPERKSIRLWQETLARDDIRVSSTGQFAPYLTSRRFFYNFGPKYTKADYIVLRRKEIFEYPEKETLIPIYLQLVNDKNFQKIYDQQGVEVYKKTK